MAIQFTRAAQENIEETGADVEADLAALRSGAHTEASLLEWCLDGADDDRVQGWREYVDAIVEAAAEEPTLACRDYDPGAPHERATR